MTQPTHKSRLLDQSDSFGWISIVLHWLTTVAVIALWFIGHSILEQESIEAIDMRRDLHATIALSVWLLLLFRIAWRIRMHHPRADGQSLFIHRVARTVHYVLLACIGVMMITGPVVYWADTKSVSDLALAVHATTASVLLALVLLHIGGTLKHIIFHEDDTIVRMIWPKKRR
jgi:cytochrome b561